MKGARRAGEGGGKGGVVGCREEEWEGEGGGKGGRARANELFGQSAIEINWRARPEFTVLEIRRFCSDARAVSGLTTAAVPEFRVCRPVLNGNV